MVKIADSVFRDPSSVQYGDVEVGEHSSLWPGSVIRGDFAPARVGRFTCVQDNSTLHAAQVGDFVTIAHNAVLDGAIVEDRCIIGIGAVIQEMAVIGEGSIVAAGAVVLERTRVPPGSVVMGVPARIKPAGPGQTERIVNNALVYAAMARTYREGKDVADKQIFALSLQEIGKIARV